MTTSDLLACFVLLGCSVLCGLAALFIWLILKVNGGA